jgi:hypothetical protein
LKPVEFWELTLSEFDRIGRGFQRRQVEQWRHTRWLATELRNGLRAPGEPGVSLHEVLPLPGDETISSSLELSPEEVEAQFAYLQTLDRDLA